MEEKYRKAFKEVYIILNSSSEEEVSKIPKSFIDFIEKNMDASYEPKIELNENFENSVLEETLLILALIYRDYLISKEERNILIQEEEKQLEKLKESYSAENLFNKMKDETIKDKIDFEQQLVVIKEEKWYERILNKILNIFKNK